MSEVSGLGNTTKIKNEIKNKSKEYNILPIGELDLTLKKKNEKWLFWYSFSLDLYKINEKSVLNEFLFSFLITKFYIFFKWWKWINIFRKFSAPIFDIFYL